MSDNDKQTLRLVRGNIALLPLDAIVTAANSALMGGGGVDGAVHRGAGPALQKALLEFDGCSEGDAVITPGFDLPAQWVIHAVGPIYIDGSFNEAETLAAAYSASLTRAAEVGAKTIAFPCISTGAFRYPHSEACSIAISTARSWLAEHALPQIIYFCVFDPQDVTLYQNALKQTALPVESLDVSLL